MLTLEADLRTVLGSVCNMSLSAGTAIEQGSCAASEQPQERMLRPPAGAWTVAAAGFYDGYLRQRDKIAADLRLFAIELAVGN